MTRAFGPYTDLAGRPIPAGRSRRELVYPALTAALPPWLTVTAGAGSYVATGIGYYRITGAGSLALRSIPVDLAAHRWVEWTVEGVHWSAEGGITAGISLKDDDDTVGVSIFQRSTDPTAVLRLVGTGAPDIATNYNWATAHEIIRRRNLTIAVGWDRSVWLAEDDQVMHHGIYPQMRLGTVRGVLDCSIAGAAREMRVTQVRMAVESD